MGKRQKRNKYSATAPRKTIRLSHVGQLRCASLLASLKTVDEYLPLRFLIGVIFLTIFIGGVSLPEGMANTPQQKPLTLDIQKKEAKQKALDELLNQPFTYQREDRSNPFTPFIKKQKAPMAVSKGGGVPEEELSGMQLFEPGQLHLVSIVFAGSRSIAMVQDSVGQGYIIKEGTKIGRRGVVEQVLANVVVIKQWSLTFSGQKRYKNIEMVLRKEGE